MSETLKTNSKIVNLNEQEWYVKILEMAVNNHGIFISMIDKKEGFIKNVYLPIISQLIDQNNLNDRIQSYTKTNLTFKFKNGSIIRFMTREDFYQVSALRQDYLFCNGSRLPDKEVFARLCSRTKNNVFILNY